MTLFDYIVGALLLISGVMGFARGATREVTAVIAFVLAAVIAVFGLRYTGSIAQHAIHPAWLADAAAILGLFIIAYIVLRLIGGALSRGVRTAGLSSLDRALGFAIGLVRGLVVIGVVSLLIGAAMPPERLPVWISQAKLYPLALAAGDGLRTFGPKGLEMAHTIAPDMDEAPPPPPETAPEKHRRAPTRDKGYSDSQRKALDDLVEKSR
jgi:membrane protein required for colicin V production